MQERELQELQRLCLNAAKAIWKMQQAFSGLGDEDDLRYNFTNDEIEKLDEIHCIISKHYEKLGGKSW